MKMCGSNLLKSKHNPHARPIKVLSSSFSILFNNNKRNNINNNMFIDS